MENRIFKPLFSIDILVPLGSSSIRDIRRSLPRHVCVPKGETCMAVGCRFCSTEVRGARGPLTPLFCDFFT